MLINKNVLTIEEDGRQLKFFSIVISKFFETLFINVLAMVTSVMLSGYTDAAVTVANLSTQVINLVLIFLEMTTVGAVIHMSMEMGRGERKRVGELAGTAMVMLLIAAVISGFGLILSAKWVMRLMNADNEILVEAATYLRIMAIFLPTTVLMRCFNYFLICNGYAHYTLASGVLYNLINVFVCYYVLYGNFHLPVSPIYGVAAGNGIACVCGLIFSAVVYIKKKCPFTFCFRGHLLKSILKMGVPGGMNGFNYNLAQTVTTALIASLGMTVFNTKIYISSIIVFSSVISFAISQAEAVFAGRYRGMEDFESMNILHRQNLFMAVGANIVVSSIVFLCRRHLLGLFTDDAQIIAFAGKIMLFDIAVQIFRAVNQVSDQALNANGDVKTTFLVSVCSCWTGSVMLSWLLGIRLGLGLLGVWLAFLFDEAFKSLIYTIRWKNGKWKYN
ncbi:MAG: hypothetical protein IJ460_01050 [Clostridia bacterium]|nr:hypothetical protein [Clostridia bacterium]